LDCCFGANLGIGGNGMSDVEKCLCEKCEEDEDICGKCQMLDEIATLRQQIVDMKRCRNCKFEDGFHNRVSEQSGHCIGCGDYENWQMKGAE
jgi:hypothetical protein